MLMIFLRKISQLRLVLEGFASRHPVTILCAFAWTLIGSVEAIEPKLTDSPEVELLRDPLLSRGVTQGYANHLPTSEREDCLSRWKAKGITDAQWAFWEISEHLHFAHNPETPLLLDPGNFIWSTADTAKQCLIANGGVRMIFDTAKEWREGGSLNLPAADGRRPKYGDANTTWPHFLIGQHFARDNDPAARIPDDDKLHFDKYNRLRFRIDIQLNRLLKNSTWGHREEYGASNHAIFYIAFVLMPKSASRLAETGKFYILAPAIYSEGDNQHVPGSLPWLGPDQFGDGVYFSGSQPVLQAGRPVHYDIDVKQIIREGLSAATQKALAQGKMKAYRPENYFLACLLVGWEVWGGFDTDVEFSNISLRGTL